MESENFDITLCTVSVHFESDEVVVVTYKDDVIFRGTTEQAAILEVTLRQLLKEANVGIEAEMIGEAPSEGRS